jgi:23S rRNA-/tRNA-specific pseudouridylate synthase
MAYLGYPILGDTVYAGHFKFKKIFDRHLLHAAKLEFQHPITKKRLRLVAELPEVLSELIKKG